MKKEAYVYILTNYEETTLYIGVTSDLEKRVYEHKNNITDGFSSQYKLDKFIYFEHLSSIHDAIRREKQLKNWHRQWKINLIKEFNPNFDDLSQRWQDAETSSA